MKILEVKQSDDLMAKKINIVSFTNILGGNRTPSALDFDAGTLIIITPLVVRHHYSLDLFDLIILAP